MSHDSFQAHIRRLETEWCGRPESLLRHTVGWVILGYLALAAPVVLGLVLLSVGVVLSVFYQSFAGTMLAGLISLAGLGLAVFVLSCLRVRFEPLEGLELQEKDHPELHRVLRELGDRAGGVRFHRIILNPEMNASVVQIPRLGVFGWYRTDLVIGLPLLEALPLDELRAVLAHEMAHLARTDGMTCAWLHRTRETWERVVNQFPGRGSYPLFRDFLLWFWPRFSSRVVVLSRFSELAADQFAAEAVSREALASGLQRLAILGKRADREFWEPLDRALDQGADLPRDVMDRLSEVVRRPLELDPAAVWLAAAVAITPGSTESHPGLAVRLAALGLPASPEGSLPPYVPDGQSSADQLFTPAFLHQTRQNFSLAWLEEANEGRARRIHRYGLEQAAGLRKAWERIVALARVDGVAKVQPEVMALLERQPAHTGALLMRGDHLAEKADPQAWELLEQAASDPTLARRALEVLERFHTSHGRDEEVTLVKKRAHQHDLELRAALVERDQLGSCDSFFPHELGDSDQQALHDLLLTQPAVSRAWLAAKEVRHLPRWPLVVIGLELDRSLSAGARGALEKQLMGLWGGEAYVMIFVLDDGLKPVLDALRRAVPDSEVFRRK